MLTLPAYWLIGLAASSGNPSKPTSHPAPTAVEVTRFGAFDDGLHVELTPTSLRASIEQGERTFTVELRTLAIARGDDVRALIASPAAGSDARRERQLDGLTEWYVPQRAGLEHGWTLSARPQGDSASPVWILLEFAGDLSPRISEDGRAAWLVDHEAQLRMRYDGLKAWDAQGQPVDARLASSPIGFGVRVNDEGAHYPITVDPVLAAAPLILTGTLGHSGFGERVSTAGDVNGDGYSDVLIVEIFYDGPELDEGRILLYHGAANGLNTSPAWQFEGNFASGSLGQGIGPAGDVNGDGFDDVILGHTYLSNPTSAPGCGGDCGEVSLYLGSSVGLAAAPVWKWSGGQSGANYGYSCATAGDVDGDGLDDVIIGARFYDSPGFTNDGAAFVFLGTLSGNLGTIPDWEQFGGENQALFGSSVTTAGDADADGFADIAVGAPLDSPTDKGRVWFYRGSSTGPLTSAIQLCPVPVGSSYLYGQSVSCAGDVNGDGFADLFVGADRGDVGLNNVGHVYVHLGRSVANGTIDGTPFDQQWGGQTDGFLGHSVAPAGDVNGDGFADLVYGEPAFLTSAPGNAYLFLGRSTASLTRDLLITGVAGDALGKCVSTAGDVNGDGFADVLIGSPQFSSYQGRVHLFYGQPKPDSTRFEQTYAASSAGAGAGSALAVGDVDADGYADLFVGEPNHSNPAAQEGVVRYYRGAASTVSSSPSWTQEGVVAGAHFGRSIAYLGDVDGDGFGDVLVGAPDTTDGQANEGKVLLFRGTIGGPSTTAQEFQSNVVGARLGASVAAAGDVNGDGLADAVVGAPGTWSGLADAGSIHVYLGQRNPPGLTVAPIVISPGLGGSKFGFSVAGAGDMNLDGYSDVIVGSPEFADGQPREGAIYVYRGSPSGLQPTPDMIVQGNSSEAEFGYAVSTAGDVNEDHFADVLVGAPGQESMTRGGFAFLYRGRSGPTILNPTPLHTIHFGQVGARTGEAVAYAGDLNGDNHADVLVGVPSWNGDSDNGGRIAVFFGTGSFLTGASAPPASSASISTAGDDQISGPGADNHLAGAALAAGADMHGHGFGDFVAGAPGAGGGNGNAYLYVGGNGVSSWRFNTQQRRHDDLSAIGLLGFSEDSTSFGVSATVAGFHPPTATLHPGTFAGREDLQIVWEAKPIGTNFNAMGLGSLAETNSGDPALPVTRTAIPVIGLAQNLNYHWRMRFELRNPYMPHSRWIQLQGNSQQEKKVGTAKDCDDMCGTDATQLQNGSALDCNNNGVPDNCDVAIFLTSSDCNDDEVPDECEVLVSDCFNDCNNNEVPDACDIAQGTSQDCNPHGPVGANGIPDECDISCGTLADSNLDGVPDECQSSVTLFCFGDGTGTNCPCSNNSTLGNQAGCRSSLGLDGRLRAMGVAAVAADTFVLLGSSMPNSSALYFQGTGQMNGGNGSVFGDGLRCASGSVLRLGTKTNASGSSQYPVPGDQAISIRGAIPAPGGTRHYQSWYRNAAAFCTASTFNLTNGLSTNWVP